MAKNIAINPDKDETLATLLPARKNPTPLNTHEPEGDVICFGVFRVKSEAAGGLWVIRRIVTDGDDKIVSYEDSEPDVLEIQMGKIDRFIESATER